MESAADNPFATRHVRPGAISYLFDADPLLSAAALIERLRQNGWCGQIVGPHGSGKSTLLRTLIPLIDQTGRRPSLVELHAGQRRFDWPANLAADGAGVLIIDGFEQLPWWRGALVKRRCRRAGWGLLVTAHRDVGLPLLYEVRPKPETAVAVVRRILDGRATAIPIGDDDILRAYADHGGSLRETLFALYDLYEERRNRLPLSPNR